MTEKRRYEAAVKTYLNNLKNTGASEQTVENYRKRLSYFRVFWISQYPNREPPSDPAFADVEAWRDYLLAKGTKASTVRQYLKELHTFFLFVSDPSLGKKRYYMESPVSKRLFPMARKSDWRPYEQILTDEQVISLWQNSPVVTKRPEYWERNYAIVVLLLTTEIRNAELLNLTPADLDFENEEIIIERGKGDKFRVVDFPPLAQTAVNLYLKSGTRPSDAPETAPLFGTYGDPRNPDKTDWGRGTSQWLSSLVERHVKAVTGVEGVRTHALRHVGARLDLNYGMSFEELQSKLGHESVNTTQIYSGKLTARRARKKTAAVFEAREQETIKNLRLLAALG